MMTTVFLDCRLRCVIVHEARPTLLQSWNESEPASRNITGKRSAIWLTMLTVTCPYGQVELLHYGIIGPVWDFCA